MERRPKVSVAMPAFHHERFIVQAIESALMQQTDFDFEIVVGDDCSTDRTRDRIEELARKAPGRIRLIVNPRNIGMLANFVQIVSACRGRYIALLEGDDYWTDPTKLQRQADLLDRRPDVAICHHNALRVADDGSRPPTPCHGRGRPRLATQDALMAGNFLVTCTVMFRGGLIPAFPDWYFQCGVGDWPLHVLNSQHGSITYLAETMAVYRVHAGGAWSAERNRGRLEGLVQTAEMMRGSLPDRQRRRLSRTVLRWRAEITELMLAEGRVDDARQYAAAHLSRATAARLFDFYQGLEEERLGRRRAASWHLLKAAARTRSQTRIGKFDIFLALYRINCPRLYRQVRACWRRWHCADRIEDRS